MSRFGKRLPDYRGYSLALGPADGIWRRWRAVLTEYAGPAIDGWSKADAPLEVIGREFREKVDAHLGPEQMRRYA
jgi:hypothetical protein